MFYIIDEKIGNYYINVECGIFDNIKDAFRKLNTFKNNENMYVVECELQKTWAKEYNRIKIIERRI